MLTLKVDENKGFMICELVTGDGEMIKIGDKFGLMPGQLADENGAKLEAGTMVEMKEILMPPKSVYNCVIIKGSLPDGKLFSGSLKSFNLNKRIVGVHDDCGGNIINHGEHTWCEKCGQPFCGCACG